MYFGYQGICTRVGDVKPLLEVACLTCDGCGFEIYQVCTVCLFQAFVLMQISKMLLVVLLLAHA